jgi:branched-chain amino acid transport system substrate-binding protein
VALAGEIGEIGFADVVQLCSRIRCTGTLVLSSTKTGQAFGHFGFEAGELVDGQLDDVQGLEAVYRALRLTEAAYRFDHGLRSAQRSIFTPIGTLLIEGMRQQDELGGNDATPGLDASPPLANSEAEAGAIMKTTERKGWRFWAAIPAALVVAALVGWMAVRGGRVLRSPAPARGAASGATLPAAPAAPRPAPAGVQGVTDAEVLFGMAAPFSGSAKELGHQMKRGVETAFAAANAAGGVHGRRLRLVAVDDGYEPARTLEAMKQLCDVERVFGFVGNVGTPTAAVALPIALERRMLFFGAFSGASLLRRDPPDRYVFNLRASYAEETAAVVSYLVKVRHLRPEQIVVFAQQDAFGDAGYAGVLKAMRALRPEGKPALRLGYKRNTVDVADAVAHLHDRSAGVRAVIMVATYRAAAKLIEKVRDNHPNMIFTNVSFVGSTALADELTLLGPRYAKGVIVTQVVPPVESYSTAVLGYKAALEKLAPGEKADYVSLEGYWAANLLIEGLKRAGPRLDTERLVEALETVHDLDLGIGTHISFGLAEHQGSHKVWGTQLDEAGHYQPIDLD